MGVKQPGWDARAAHREDSVTYSYAEQYRKPEESLGGNRYRGKAGRLQACKAEGSSLSLRSDGTTASRRRWSHGSRAKDTILPTQVSRKSLPFPRESGKLGIPSESELILH